MKRTAAINWTAAALLLLGSAMAAEPEPVEQAEPVQDSAGQPVPATELPQQSSVPAVVQAAAPLQTAPVAAAFSNAGICPVVTDLVFEHCRQYPDDPSCSQAAQ